MRPLIFSTEIAATFHEVADIETDADTEPEGDTLADLDPDAPNVERCARKLFKRRLHGMINVRMDGKDLYAARRVASGYWWESYGPLAPAPRSDAPL